MISSVVPPNASELEFGNIDSHNWEQCQAEPQEEKTGVPGEIGETLNPHDTESGIKTGLHWWETSALTTAPSLLPQMSFQCEKVICRPAAWIGY